MIVKNVIELLEKNAYISIDGVYSHHELFNNEYDMRGSEYNLISHIPVEVLLMEVVSIYSTRDCCIVIEVEEDNKNEV